MDAQSFPLPPTVAPLDVALRAAIIGHWVFQLNISFAGTRSARLTIFWHCGFEHFSSRTGSKARPRLTNHQWFWPRIGLPKGLAMLIRSEMFGVHGKAAFVAGPEAIPAASMPTRLLGGLLLLICP